MVGRAVPVVLGAEVGVLPAAHLHVANLVKILVLRNVPLYAVTAAQHRVSLHVQQHAIQHVRINVMELQRL